MKRAVKFLFVCLLLIGFLVGCDGCFDDALTNKVDAPNFTIVRGTNYNVVLSSNTEGATVKYTTDGSDPTESDTAVEAGDDPVTIDFFTTIKAYATKDGKRDSKVLSFKIPRFGSKRQVAYTVAESNVDHYFYYADDPNSQEKLEIKYTGKGADEQWFTYDDTIEYYNVFIYDGATLKEKYRRNSAGSDGEWFTSDDADAYQYKYVYTYSDNNIETVKIYDSSDNLSDTGTYTYSDGVLSQIAYDAYTETYDGQGRLSTTNESGTSMTVTYTTTTGDDRATYSDGTNTLTYVYDGVQQYKYQYTTSGSTRTGLKYLGYGADAQWGYSEILLDASGYPASKTMYWDNAGSTERAYYEYTYTNGNLDSQYKYKGSDKAKLRYWTEYSYDQDYRVTQIDFYNADSDKEQYKEYTYADSTNGSYYLMKRPDVSTFSLAVNFTVSAGSVSTGSYAFAGGTFDYDGAPLDNIFDDTSTETQIVKTVSAKLRDLVENVETSNSSLTFPGSEGGDFKIMISTYDNTVNIVFEFNEYNDGDVFIDGTMDMEMSGTIDASGELSGTLDGRLYGDLMVADANPDFDDDDYITEAYATLVLDSTLKKVTQELEYDSAGDDATWDAVEDNNIKYARSYSYDASGNILEEAQYNVNAKYTDFSWNSLDSYTLNYKKTFTYSGSDPATETVTRDYGAYGNRTAGTSFQETLAYSLCWRLWWDVDQFYEIDWDDEYWNEDEDEEDQMEWTVE